MKNIQKIIASPIQPKLRTELRPNLSINQPPINPPIIVKTRTINRIIDHWPEEKPWISIK